MTVSGGSGAPKPARLLRPRSVAVVGANERPGSYADTLLRNLAASGFEGAVWGVNPNYESVHGHRCVASVAVLPEPVDAVVVAIPAAAVPAVVAEAGERGCGGAVVISAGFGEVAAGVELERELRVAALGTGLAVCGPNGNGIVSVAGRAPLWGDSVAELPPAGPVALITQSGNVGVNALGSRRGIGFHTVVSTGNQAVLEAADWIEAVAELDGVGSIALFLEADGDGARMARALGRCAERGIGVAALKVGSSEAGARAAGAHTGALAGDHRVFASLLEEAGVAIASDPGELLELARCLAQPAARPSGTGGLAILTCSGGDSGIAADLAGRAGLVLPELGAATRERLGALLPAAATIGNPLDYTAMLWDQPEALEAISEAVGSDPSVDQMLLFFDQPDGLAPHVATEWEAVRSALLSGAVRSGTAVLLASTLPELLERTSAVELAARGVATAAGLGEAITCARALRAPRAAPRRLEEIAAASELPAGAPGAWLGEAESKALLRDGGLTVPAGGEASEPEGALEIARRVGWPVALKVSSPTLQHKSEAGALALGIGEEEELRRAAERLRALPAASGGTLLVERMVAADGPELFFAAHREGVVPVLAVGLGGIWTEAIDDVRLIPLPASEDRVERALRELRGAAVLSGARGGRHRDLGPAARFGSRLGELLLEANLDLLEVNPAVLLEDDACVALDAVARRSA